MCSGNDVVGEATIPPLGAKVSALSVINERCTRSDHSPTTFERELQSVQNCVVRATASAASIGVGIGS